MGKTLFALEMACILKENNHTCVVILIFQRQCPIPQEEFCFNEWISFQQSCVQKLWKI